MITQCYQINSPGMNAEAIDPKTKLFLLNTPSTRQSENKPGQG